MRTRLGSLILLVCCLPSSPSPVRAESDPARPGWTGTWQQADGLRVAGRLIVDDGSVVRFVSEGTTDPGPPLKKGTTILLDGPGPDRTDGSPPFRIELGLDRRISGRLGTVDERQIQLDASSVEGGVTVARAGAHSVVQRLGEVQLLDEGFETLDSRQWTLIGNPELVDNPKVAGQHSLRIPAGGTSVTRQIDEPVLGGRLELAFYDTGATTPDHQSFVDLLFRSPTGPAPVRVVLGWSEESHSVESPAGPALAVQRLARKPGWHRLSFQFNPDQTEIAIDGNHLAHGKGPGGPLLEIRLATRSAGRSPAPVDLAATFDELWLVRFADAATALEIDPTQDEVRLSGGDQVFGKLRHADASHVTLNVDSRDVNLPWSEVTGIHFRRAPTQAQPIEGTWLRVEWRAAPGNDPLDLDRVDGALVNLDADHLTLEVPYAGRVTLSRQRVKRIEVLGHSRRIVVDPTSHHLGNDLADNTSPLDPPQPEGRLLERDIELEAVPSGPAVLSLDVVQVAGEASGLPFFDLVKKGEIRTKVAINGQTFDYLNRYIASKNETPERIELPIPSGLLHPGKNHLRIEQFGTATEPNYLDDLGILEIAIEFPHLRAQSAAPDKP